MITIPNVAFIITPNLKSATLGDNITTLYINTFGQSDVNIKQYNITLESISVKENITINELNLEYYASEY